MKPDYTRDGINLYLGDCYEVLPQLQPGIGCVLTDPPYKLEIAGGNKGFLNKTYQKLVSTELDAIAHGFDVSATIEQLARLQPERVSMFLWCGNRQISSLMREGELRGWSTTLLVWEKPNSCPFSHNTWRQDAEFCIHYRKRGPMNGNARVKRKVKSHATLQHAIKRFGHPCPKPVPILCDYITIGSHEGDIVLDPFMGSASTGVACIETNRRFIGIEHSPEYFEAAIKRIETALALKM